MGRNVFRNIKACKHIEVEWRIYKPANKAIIG